jgi:diguanylate cyclase (GGDEF)-like protein
MSQLGTERSAQDLLESIFKVATALMRGERASLLLRDDANDPQFTIAMSVGLADDVRERVRVREGEGVAGLVAATKRPVLVREPHDAPLPLRSEYRSASYVSVPIVVADRAQGILNITDRADGRPFDVGDLETLEVLAGHIATCLVQRRRDAQLVELAETDGLTRLFNRRHFDRRLESELRRAQRTGDPLALLLMDVNAFKQINDRLGHRVGDEVLRVVADAMRRSLRTYDIPVRYGGDEFAVILPSADAIAAASVGERIISAVAGAIPSEVISAVPNVGLSVGVGTVPPAADARGLVDGADTAMYEAKAEGGGVNLWHERKPTVPSPTRRRRALPAPYLVDPARLARADLQALVPGPLAEEWNVLVIGREGNILTVVMPEPSNAATEAISGATGYAVYPVYSAAAEIEAARRSLAARSD